ncbi:hypothetical protein Pan161_18230 [Gimesia algae]|uniref:Uncharacterized protein n=1 Tax=Gimesia algae TaxID=2527971 RepID=A0A517VAY5_9PLAN|nr:hypothetical protein Pan161_18230 [Gimesia algae]
MTTQPTVKQTGSNRTKEGHAVSGCRIVHVSVPESTFNHAKAQAYLSGISWSTFVELLLKNSKPITKSTCLKKKD